MIYPIYCTIKNPWNNVNIAKLNIGTNVIIHMGRAIIPQFLFSTNDCAPKWLNRFTRFTQFANFKIH